MGCTGSLFRFLTCAFDGFLGLFGYSLSCLLGFFSDRFRGLLGFLGYSLGSFLNFLACFLCPLLYLLACPFLPKRGERSGRDQSENQTCYSHAFPPVDLHFLYKGNGSGVAIARLAPRLLNIVPRLFKIAYRWYAIEPRSTSVRKSTQASRRTRRKYKALR